MTNFEGIKAKIRRAGDLIRLLKADMDRYCEDIQKAIAHEVHKDTDEHIWVFRGATPNTLSLANC